jgi:hypothetical protein
MRVLNLMDTVLEAFILLQEVCKGSRRATNEHRISYRIIFSLTWNARREVAPAPTLPLLARANILLWLRVQCE